MTAIRLSNLSKRFGVTRAVDHVELTIEAGALFFLLGPSGCGKTTLLRMLAGFVTPDEGEIYFNHQAMNDVPPRRRNAGMVFQNYALWPHRTVSANVAYGLEVRGLSRWEIRKRVEQALKLVRLEGLGDRRPAQLSGGQQQRVALARALVIQPQVLLLDEPLSNLDARLRLEMREEIRRIHVETKLTMVYVTHDQKETLSLADRIAVMHQGRLMQVGSPVEVYTRPVSRFVAGFMGECNFIPGTVRELLPEQRCLVQTPMGVVKGTLTQGKPLLGREVVCAVRPESLNLATEKDNRFDACVERTAFLGELLHVHLRSSNLDLQAVALQNQRDQWTPGTMVSLSMSPDQVVVLME